MNSISRIIEGLQLALRNEDINEMASVGRLPDDPSIEIFVHSNDGGNIPHFHVWKRKNSGYREWETCLMFQEASYFKHKKFHTDIKTSIAKEIDKFLRSPDPEFGGAVTNWQTAVAEWNRNNSSMKLVRNIQQPDYSKLNK